MIQPGDIIPYRAMLDAERVNSLQRGMNFRVSGNNSIILMSLRKNAPYADRVEENGKVLIYEGHDIYRNQTDEDPKTIDQPMTNNSGSLTDNGKFYQAAREYTNKKAKAELVRVYEKIKDGIWVYNGVFELHDAWVEESDCRNVFKFKLQVTDKTFNLQEERASRKDLEHNRMIPTAVKLEVLKRDKRKCVLCGKTDNLHFDHILPYSKGGTSLKAENIQLLCARHNLEKRDRII